MNLYALDNTKLVLAHHAVRDRSYLCPECHGVVRIRGGGKRQIHFYHTHRPASCRQHGKSLAHLQMQLYLKSRIPSLELEKRFGSRIADACWLDAKIVFEIQCSPISPQEAKSRCDDYLKLGFTPVWILHDRRYNRFRTSPAEEYLRDHTTTFYTDGRTIYDQFDVCHNFRRHFRGPKLPINPAQPLKQPLEPLFSRHWPLSFAGDLFDRSTPQQLEHLKTIVKRYQAKPGWAQWVRWKEAYRFILYRLLEATG
ncbi:MAG TPA: competence protein CoiA family protein [Rhabdochlamydiaceae bacterium]|nr:competence protein CoiA family protein [Rhabdochlamydiaceae bacterium]